MIHNRPNLKTGVGMGPGAFALLVLLALMSGCAQNDAKSRAEEERKFLAPTDVSKLTPAARANLPGGSKFQPNNGAVAPK